MWGPKGLFITHSTFELGVATLILPMKLSKAMPTSTDIKKFNSLALGKWFRATAQGIASLGLYDTFYKFGWTIPLSYKVRRQLAPELVKSVTLVWYAALNEANLAKRQK